MTIFSTTFSKCFRIKEFKLEDERKKNLPGEETDTMSLDKQPNRKKSGTLPAEDDEPNKEPVEELPKDC